MDLNQPSRHGFIAALSRQTLDRVNHLHLHGSPAASWLLSAPRCYYTWDFQLEPAIPCRCNPVEFMWPLNKREQPLDVDQWRREVADAIQPPKPPKRKIDPPSPRKLRSSGRVGRSGLCSIAGNRQKLPPSATARLVTGEPAAKRRQMSATRGPGRPPGRGRGGSGRGTEFNRGRSRGGAADRTGPQQAEEQEQQDDSDDIDYLIAGTKRVPLKDPDDPRSSKVTSSKSRSRSASRSRKAYGFDQPISASQVSLKYLASCNPSVRSRRVDQVRVDFSEKVYRPTVTLYNKMIDIPSNLIPLSLKGAYEQQVDTPRKSRDAPPIHQYASSSGQFYPQTLLPQIMKKVDEVRKEADWNEENEADEDQWSLVVHLLLAEVASWPRAQPTKILKTLVASGDFWTTSVADISRVSSRCIINPPSIYTKMPGGRPLDYSVSKSTETKSDQSTDRTISKMVDWSLGLEINYKDNDKISRAFSFCDDQEHSLNQSMSFIRRVPLFADLELKKKLQSRDPAVQLAIWKSAWLLKAQHHEWDTSLPLPGITVAGHEWSFYLFMAVEDGLIMLGSFPMGTTATLNGVWMILCRLNVLFNWGTTTYKKWFDDNIMSWAEKTEGGAVLNDLSIRGADES
ncbi:MAG: hypothetical protein Q9211_001893 [Gyalolechia sp. 1 TL-2023]